jgi:HD-like signal output (HDOD) protein
VLDRDIARKLLDVEELPTLPIVIDKIIEAVEGGTASAQELTAILEQDMAISTRVLRLANSAFYGLRFKVDSIRRAVVVVGFDAVRMLALATSVFDTLSAREQFAIDPFDFWLHSLGTAKAAQILAKGLLANETLESCFTAGLLHDMGKYCLALSLREKYVEITKQARAEKRRLCDIESEVLETTHALAGMWVAQKWRLPPVITDTIGNQYRFAGYRGNYRPIVAVVTLASELSRKAGFGDAADFNEPVMDENAMAFLELSPERLQEIENDLRENSSEARMFLESLGQSG